MPAPETSPAKSRWWLEPLIWTVGFAIAISVAAYVNETASEIVMQGLAYLFTFLSTPFVLEATSAFIGLCIVFVINTRRIEREGDGWVEMEVKQPAAAANQDATKQETVI